MPIVLGIPHRSILKLSISERSITTGVGIAHKSILKSWISERLMPTLDDMEADHE